MRSAERELLEIERKRQADSQTLAMTSKTKTSNSDAMRQRIQDITLQIAEESKRLAATRAQLQRLKKSDGRSPEKAAKSVGNAKETTPVEVKSVVDKKAVPGGGGGGAGAGRNATHPVPESLYPELCRLLKSAGPDGITKVVEKFVARHPVFAKRQVEIKIGELAVKEKKGDDACKVWHIKPEFVRYLDESSECDAPDLSSAVELESGKRRPTADVDPNLQSASKRARKDEESSPVAMPAVSEPKKFKRAFGFFVKAKRPEAEAHLGPDASVRLPLPK